MRKLFSTAGNPKSLENQIGELSHNEKAAFSGIKRESVHMATLRGEKYLKVGVNVDKIRERQKAVALSRQDYSKEFGKKLREKHSVFFNARKREWYKNNKERVTEYNRNYANDRRKIDINFRMRMNLRNRLRLALKAHSKSAGLIQLMGCSIADLLAYLENKFAEGMTWDNYGAYWVVDHIVPCSAFDLSVPEEQQKCFHYTNLQPLTAQDNLAKGCRILSEHLPQ